ncbi:hypothetical protein PENTCL1PPCAC_28591, partial [Pristionchus entomophagus]
QVMRALLLLLLSLAISSAFVLPLAEIFGDGRPRSERSLTRSSLQFDEEPVIIEPFRMRPLTKEFLAKNGRKLKSLVILG